jgi:hypothetical protein
MIQDALDAGKVPPRPLAALRNLFVRNIAFRSAVASVDAILVTVIDLLPNQQCLYACSRHRHRQPRSCSRCGRSRGSRCGGCWRGSALALLAPDSQLTVDTNSARNACEKV